jgi:hypothetical protein
LFANVLLLREKKKEREKEMEDRTATLMPTNAAAAVRAHKVDDADALRMREDDYGMVQLKKNVGEVDEEEENEDNIATDSELDEELNKEEEMKTADRKNKNDDENKEETDEIQSTKTNTISTRELIVKRKANVDELMGLYEQTYYDLIETMRKRHRKFQLKHGHAGLKSAATALANARGVPKAGNNKDNANGGEHEGDEQQQQQQQQNGTRTTCSSETCEKNALPFARFCFEHVSLDAKQRFYEVNAKSGELEWRVNEKFKKPTPLSSDAGTEETTPAKDANAKEENALPESATDPKPLKEMSPGPPGGGANPNASTSPGGADMSLAASLGLL